LIAREGCFFASDHTTESRFSSTVWTNNGNFFPTSDLKIKISEDVEIAVLLSGILELSDKVGGGGRIRKAERHYRVFSVDLDTLDLSELLDARLDLRCFVGLGTEAIDELFCFGDLAILVYLLFAKIILTLLELGFVG
jgi:hypothetical protein